MTFKTTTLATALAVAALGLTARADEPPKPEYPLTVCVITNRPLDSMGGEVSIVHEGTEVKFCCQGCVGAFRRNPEPHLARIRAAAEAKAEEARPASVTPYPLAVCIVSGEGLGSHPVEIVHEGRQIKFCCNGCRASFEDSPADFLKKLDAAQAGEPRSAAPAHRHHH